MKCGAFYTQPDRPGYCKIDGEWAASTDLVHQVGNALKPVVTAVPAYSVQVPVEPHNVVRDQNPGPLPELEVWIGNFDPPIWKATHSFVLRLPVDINVARFVKWPSVVHFNFTTMITNYDNTGDTPTYELDVTQFLTNAAVLWSSVARRGTQNWAIQVVMTGVYQYVKSVVPSIKLRVWANNMVVADGNRYGVNCSLAGYTAGAFVDVTWGDGLDASSDGALCGFLSPEDSVEPQEEGDP